MDKDTQLTKEQVELELTSALKTITLAFRDIGFGDNHILGKVNCILQGFIKDDGDFTDEYKDLARQAIEMRKQTNDTPSIITNIGY